MADLSGTVALVTGASSGIGEATALALSAAGRAGRARRPSRRPPARGRRPRIGDGALVIEADVTDQTGGARRRADRRGVRPARHARQQRRRDAARPDRRRPARRVGADGEHQRLRRSSTARTPRSPICSRRRRTRRVASPTWSTSARLPAGDPAAGSAVYNLTKYGVGAFSESLRQEVTGRHVRVSLVEPGAVATELSGAQPPGDPREHPRPLRRHGAHAGVRHRRRDRLHRHPAAAHVDQRDPHPADRASR